MEDAQDIADEDNVACVFIDVDVPEKHGEYVFHDDIVIASDDSDGDDNQYVPHMAIAEVLKMGNL